jgi:predicted  nucleic acid-binding Zn-ribbon protein
MQSRIESLQWESESKNREASAQIQDLQNQITELEGSCEEAAQLKTEKEGVIGDLEHFNADVDKMHIQIESLQWEF